MGTKLVVGQEGVPDSATAKRMLTKAMGMPVLPSYLKLRQSSPEEAIKKKGTPEV
jgi:hypothetical protein